MSGLFLLGASMVLLALVVTAQDRCDVASSDRYRCGPSLSQTECEDRRCCWDPTAFFGNRCFHPRDVCAFNPCLPGATCTNIGPVGSGEHLCPCPTDPTVDCRLRQGSCAVPAGDRVACGKVSGFTIPPWQVCMNRGCCYNNETPKVPWCFHPISATSNSGNQLNMIN